MFEKGYEITSKEPRDWERKWYSVDTFLINYFLESDGRVRLWYGASSELPYCCIHGVFWPCWDCHDYDNEHDVCTAEAEYISREEAERRILEERRVMAKVTGQR